MYKLQFSQNRLRSKSCSKSTNKNVSVVILQKCWFVNQRRQTQKLTIRLFLNYFNFSKSLYRLYSTHYSEMRGLMMQTCVRKKKLLPANNNEKNEPSPVLFESSNSIKLKTKLRKQIVSRTIINIVNQLISMSFENQYSPILFVSCIHNLTRINFELRFNLLANNHVYAYWNQYLRRYCDYTRDVEDVQRRSNVEGF